MNALVERSPVHRAVHPVMPCVLQDEEDRNVHSHYRPGGEGNVCCHTAISCHWVEEPDLGEFDSEMTDEDEFRTFPLVGRCRNLLPLDLVFVEIGYLTHDDPGKTSTEIDHLVHDETHDTSSKDIVLHIGIPALSRGSVRVLSWRSAKVLTAQRRSKIFR